MRVVKTEINDVGQWVIHWDNGTTLVCNECDQVWDSAKEHGTAEDIDSYRHWCKVFHPAVVRCTNGHCPTCCNCCDICGSNQSYGYCDHAVPTNKGKSGMLKVHLTMDRLVNDSIGRATYKPICGKERRTVNDMGIAEYKPMLGTHLVDKVTCGTCNWLIRTMPHYEGFVVWHQFGSEHSTEECK